MKPAHGRSRRCVVPLLLLLASGFAPLRVRAQDATHLCNPEEMPGIHRARELATLRLPQESSQVLRWHNDLVSSLQTFDDLVRDSAPTRIRICAIDHQQQLLTASEESLVIDGGRYNGSCGKRARSSACLDRYQSLVQRQQDLAARQQALDEEIAASKVTSAGLLSQFQTIVARIQGEMTLLCAVDVPGLQDRYQSLRVRINENEQIVRNFGFSKTTLQIEQWGEVPQVQMQDSKKEFRRLLLDASLGTVTEGVQAVGSLTPDEVAALNRLADADGAPSLGIVEGARDVTPALHLLEQVKDTAASVNAARQKRMLDAAVNLGGMLFKNPLYGLLLSADEWALYQLYHSADAVVEVHRLTRLSEGDLQLLHDRSLRLVREVHELKAVQADVSTTGQACDNTSLVEPPH
jgi:hypothetical protein